MVYGYGINDTPRGWRLENEWNKRVYEKWKSMFGRCYSEKYQEKHPTYIGCTVCERWLLLSNFTEDIPKIDGYDKELFLNGKLELDKDIKSNGENKEYSLENCLWVIHAENVRQSNKTKDYSCLSVKINQYDKQGNFIKLWSSSMEIKRKLGIDQSNIIACCKFWGMNCDKEKWYETYKQHPIKSASGFVWKYDEE